MTRRYATTAHAALLPQLRVLHASMRRHCGDFRLHVLTESEEVMDWCCANAGPLGVDPIMVRHLLQHSPDIAADRLPGPPRTPREVAITQRWRHVVDLLADGIGPVTSLDVDMMFWSSPEPVFEEIGAAAMAVSPHDFPPAARGLPGASHETHIRYGHANAGWVYFADPAPAARFAEFCRVGPISVDFVHADGVTRWGEQGCLDVVAAEFSAHVIRHPGVNMGPWNIHGRTLRAAHDGRVFVDGIPLVSYHYQSLRGARMADPSYEITQRQVETLYHPYLGALFAAAGGGR